MTLAERIAELEAIYGSGRALARALGIDHAYLWRLSRGDKTAPSDDVLRKLGLRRVVTVDYLPLRAREVRKEKGDDA